MITIKGNVVIKGKAIFKKAVASVVAFWENMTVAWNSEQRTWDNWS